jgi:spore germination protein KC
MHQVYGQAAGRSDLLVQPIKRRTFFILLAANLIVCLLLAGCWDRREIEERTSVVAVGIDRDSENPRLLEVSVQIPIPIRIAGSGGNGGGGAGVDTVKIESASGRTVLECMQNLQRKLNQQLFYGHTRVIAISEQIARGGVETIFDPFRRDPEIRRLLWPLVTKGRAGDLLRISPRLEQIPTVYIMTMIENGAKIGQIPDMNLGSFFIDLSNLSAEPYLNYLEVMKNDLKWSGIAVFKRDKMIGTLNDREAWAMMRFTENRNGGMSTFPFQGDPTKLITVNTEFIRRSERVGYENGRVVDRIRVQMESNVLEKTFAGSLFTERQIKQIEADAEKELNGWAERVVKKLQREYRSDIIGVGNRIRAFHPDLWRRLDWERDFPRADIKVTFDIKLRNTGMEMK